MARTRLGKARSSVSGRNVFIVECKDCHAHGACALERDRAVDRWNTRVADGASHDEGGEG